VFVAYKLGTLNIKA